MTTIDLLVTMFNVSIEEVSGGHILRGSIKATESFIVNCNQMYPPLNIRCLLDDGGHFDYHLWEIGYETEGSGYVLSNGTSSDNHDFCLWNIKLVGYINNIGGGITDEYTIRNIYNNIHNESLEILVEFETKDGKYQMVTL